MGSFQLEYAENGEVFAFDGESITIGRDESSDFVLDHPTVSRQHAQIVDEGRGQFRLVALSRNGLTALGGERVQDSAELYDGSLLHFGKLEFTFKSRGTRTRSESTSSRGHAPSSGSPRGGHQTSSRGSGGTGADRARDAGRDSSSGRQSETDRQPGASQQPGETNPRGHVDSQEGGGGADSSIDPHTEEDVVQDIVGGAAQDGEDGNISEGSGELDADLDGGPDDDGLVDEDSEETEEDEITSWDDIAASAGPDEDDNQPQGDDVNPEESFASSMRNQSSDEEDEETDQRVVVGGLGLAVLFLLWSFWPGGGGSGNSNQVDEEEGPPLAVQVDCIGTDECRRKAIGAYQSGMGYFDRRSAKIGNLFDAYRKLYEAKKFLEKGGIEKRPSELEGLRADRKKMRKLLDQKFKNFKVEYHIAQKEERQVEMAGALMKIQRYFHDESSREYQWARKRKLEMKNKGLYPSQRALERGL